MICDLRGKIQLSWRPLLFTITWCTRDSSRSAESLETCIEVARAAALGNMARASYRHLVRRWSKALLSVHYSFLKKKRMYIGVTNTHYQGLTHEALAMLPDVAALAASMHVSSDSADGDVSMGEPSDGEE